MATNQLTFPLELRKDIDVVMTTMGRELPEEWRPLFEMRNSSKVSEKILNTYGFGNAQEIDEGGYAPEDEGGESWLVEFEHIETGLAYTVTKRAQMNNQHRNVNLDYARRARRSMRDTHEIYAVNVLNNAFSSSYLGGDGKALLDTGHPLSRPGAGTFDNKLAVAAQLSETALRDIRIKIKRCKDEDGKPMGLRSTRLIIPVELETVASRLIQSTMRPGTGDNDINWIKSNGMFPQGMYELTRLTSATAWYVQTDAPDGLIHYTRQAPQAYSWVEEGTRNLRTRMDEMFSVGWANSRCLFGSEGA